MELIIKPLPIYMPLFRGIDGSIKNDLQILLPAPRHSYKSTHIAKCILAHYLAFPDNDVIIGVDSDTNAGEGQFAEIAAYIIAEGLNSTGMWKFKDKSIQRIDQLNQIRIYRVQTSKKTDVNATKGDKTLRLASLIVFDEVQKLWGDSQLTQALSTFNRQVRNGYSLTIIAGNKERGEHWFNDYIEACERDDDWQVITPSYLDAPAWVKPKQQKLIEFLKKNDPAEYEFVFLGNVNAKGASTVFPQFDPIRHMVRRETIANRFEDIVIGVDHATNNDALAATPGALLDNGKIIALERLYNSPLDTGEVLAPSQQAELFRDYLLYLDTKYRISRNKINVCISIDCAASGFIAQLRLLKDIDNKNRALWDCVEIYEFTQKDKERNLGIIRDAFRKDILSILIDDDEYKFISNKGNQPILKDKLEKELKAQRYTDERKLDDKVPNDLPDSLEYMLVPLLVDCYFIYFPNAKYKYNSKTGYIEED